MSEEKAAPKPRHLLILAFESLGRYAPHYLASLLCQYVSYLTFGVGAAWAIRLFAEGVTAGSREAVTTATWVMLGNAAAMSLSVVAGIYLNFLSTEKVAQSLRTKVVRRALGAPVAYFDDHPVSETLASLLNDVDTAKDVLGELEEISGQAFLAISSTVTLFTWGWQAALILLAAGSMCGLLGLAFLEPARCASREYQGSRAKVTSFATGAFGGMAVVKSLLAEGIMKRKFRHISGRQKELGKRESTLLLLSNSIPSAVSETAGVGVLAAVGWLALSAKTDLARGIGLWQLATLAIPAFIKVPTRWVELQPSMVAWERLRDALEMPQEALDMEAERDAETADADEASSRSMVSKESHPQVPAVEFDSVTFSYRPGVPVLREVSFSVRDSQKIALVGPSGTGKTTVFRLLMGMYSPSVGNIRVRGRRIASIPLRDLRLQMALVPQEPWIFPGTVAENIALGNCGASRDEVVLAATMANAHEFTSALPCGYETQLTERGGNISGGERQRICLARAFLRDSEILLLDEPTSSVDAGSERLIKEAVDRLGQGRTVITISHTGKMIEDCDAVFALRQAE